MTHHLDLEATSLAHRVFPAAVAAGIAIMRHFTAHTPIEHKADGSPVSDADRDAETILVAALNTIAPSIPVIAEETASSGASPQHGDTFFLVDPLDGTREFAARRKEFTINVALIHNQTPVFGLIFAPALGQVYWTEGPDAAFEAQLPQTNWPTQLASITKRRIKTRARHKGGQTVVASRSHGSEETEAWLAGFDIAERLDLGSSLKFCLVASAQADFYPRFGPTMEWDTAAGHAIVCAAGGSVTRTDGQPFLYGKSADGYRNPGFIAWADTPHALPASRAQ